MMLLNWFLLYIGIAALPFGHTFTILEPNKTSIWYSDSLNNRVSWKINTTNSYSPLSIELMDETNKYTLFLKSRIVYTVGYTNVPVPRDILPGNFYLRVTDINEQVVAESEIFRISSVANVPVLDNTEECSYTVTVFQPETTSTCVVQPIISYTTICA